MKYTVTPFGRVDNQDVDLITINNRHNMQMSVTNYGCIVTSIRTPDKHGEIADINLGYENLDKYLAGHPFFSAIAGRFANRIANSSFELDGNTYSLFANEAPTTHLHGGKKGFDKCVWDYNIEEKDDAIWIHLHRVSPDGEEGYPGNLSVTHSIGLDNNNQIHFNFSATTDKPTIVNLVNHGYYNLAGADQGDIKDHRLKLYSDFYTPVDSKSIPTGEIASVADTGFDFREETLLRENMDKLPMGSIDHNFVINRQMQEDGLYKAAEISETTSGRKMEVFTTQPGVQVYNALYLQDMGFIGRHGKEYQAHAGICFETQHFPDSPHQAHFPSVRLNPGEVFIEKTMHRFSW